MMNTSKSFHIFQLVNTPLKTVLASFVMSEVLSLGLEFILTGKISWHVFIIAGTVAAIIATIIANITTQFRAHIRQQNAQLKALTDELEITNRQLISQNEELEAFAQTVAHDLKTPLTVLSGYSQLLVVKYEQLSSEQLYKYLATIDRTSDKMSRIVEELLLLASVRQMDEVDLVPLDTANILHEVQERLSSMIQEHQAELILPPTWHEAVGYPAWIEEVWANYLSNALKYGGKPPRIEVGSTLMGNHVRFWVRDNGEGLAPDQQAKLFVPFTRLEPKRIEGHGLGLSIVQRILEKLGGEVGVETPGIGEKGCAFYFILPASSLHPS